MSMNVRGTVRRVQGEHYEPLVVRPRRADEPEILRFDDRLFEGGDDSVILWSGQPRTDARRALGEAQRMAIKLAKFERQGGAA